MTEETAETAEQKLARYEYVLDAQADEIDKLRAEVERLRATSGAHGVLRSIYLNGELPESLRAKAAIGAIQHETPRLQPERAPLELKPIEPESSLAERCELKMKRQLAYEGREIEVQPDGQAILLKPSNGNGDDTAG
jgi:hypothetical protein